MNELNTLILQSSKREFLHVVVSNSFKDRAYKNIDKFKSNLCGCFSTRKPLRVQPVANVASAFFFHFTVAGRDYGEWMMTSS